MKESMEEVNSGSNDTAEAVQSQLNQTEEIQAMVEQVEKGTENIIDSMNQNKEAIAQGNANVGILVKQAEETVDIQENLLPEENYEEKKEETAHDIVAADDGLITEMITRSGTPVVTVGTPVKKGDVLVNGYVEILNDDGETAQYLYRTADADVIAKVTYSYHDEIPMEYVKKVSTGAEKITYQVRILDYLIENPFFSPVEEPYEVVSDVSQFHFTDNFYLPVYLVRQTYLGYKNEQKTYTEKEAKRLASENLKKYLDDLEEKGIQITEKNVIIERTKKKYVVKGTIGTLKSIVSYQPTKIIEQSSEERQPTDESD